MDDVTRDRFTFTDFHLQSGEVMPEVTIAYCTRGKLAPDGRNAVLVTHGYTSGHQMIEPSGTLVRRLLDHAGRPRRADRYGA